jgi:phage-related tail protein
MEIHVKYDRQDLKNLKVDIKGFEEEADLSKPEDFFFDASAIVMAVVDGLVEKFAKTASLDEKKEIAEMITDDTKQMIDSFYDDIDSAYKEQDPLSFMHDDMLELYDSALRKSQLETKLL